MGSQDKHPIGSVADQTFGPAARRATARRRVEVTGVSRKNEVYRPGHLGGPPGSRGLNPAGSRAIQAIEKAVTGRPRMPPVLKNAFA
jgi:hypothetical protein